MSYKDDWYKRIAKPDTPKTQIKDNPFLPRKVQGNRTLDPRMVQSYTPKESLDNIIKKKND
jgi:hypothetical protein